MHSATFSPTRAMDTPISETAKPFQRVASQVSELLADIVLNLAIVEARLDQRARERRARAILVRALVPVKVPGSPGSPVLSEADADEVVDEADDEKEREIEASVDTMETEAHGDGDGGAESCREAVEVRPLKEALCLSLDARFQESANERG